MVVVALTLALVAASPAMAQPSDAETQARAHITKADAHFRAGEYDQALPEYKAAYEVLPLPGLLWNIGLTYEKLGDSDNAAIHYRRYITENPDGERRRHARAKLALIEREQTEKRARARQTARERAAQGDASLATEDYPRALELFNEAYDLDPKPEYLFSLGRAHEGNESWIEAIDHYERYLALAPEGEHRIVARRRVIELEGKVASANRATRTPDPIVTAPPPPIDEPSRERAGWFDPDWRWIAAGAGLIALGVVADVVPDSGDNGELDAMDFVPAGLYVAGGTIVIIGVF